MTESGPGEIAEYPLFVFTGGKISWLTNNRKELGES